MLLTNDLGWCKCSNPPVDFSTANVGGSIASGPVFMNGGTVGELFFSIDPDVAGGSSITQTTKGFIRNASTTNTAKNCSVHIENCIDDAPSLNTVSFQGLSSLDDSTVYMRVIGFDGSGNPVQADVTLNGVTMVTTVQTFLHISRVEFRSTVNDALVPLNGNGTIRSGATILGVSPRGLTGCLTEISIIVESILNSSTTIATTAANPSGTFSKPRTLAQSIAFAGDLSHIAGPNRQGIWCRQVIPAATLGSEEIDFSLFLSLRV